MHQLISKKKTIYLFLFFFLVSINNFSIMNLGFPKIENIEISGVTTEESKEIEKAIKAGIYSFSGILNLQKGINRTKTNPIRSDAIRIGGTESFNTNLVIGKALPWAAAIKSKINKCFKGNLLSHCEWVSHRFI